MNFAEKIKADFEAITGLTLLYGSRDGINWAINHNALPAGFFTLIRSSNVDADGLSIKESAEVAVSVIRLSPAEEPGYETEQVIELCRQQVFAYLTALKSSGLLELRSVTRASRIFDEFDDIVCGFGVNIVVKEIDGTRCTPWEGPTLNITENGDFDTLRYGQVHVNVQGGGNIEPLTVTPTDEPQTITPTAGVDGFAPVVVGACPVCPTPHIQPLSVTPSTSNQTFTPSDPVDGYGPVDVAAVDSTIDHNIQPQNIKSGVDILGVTGAYHGTIAPLNVSPATTAQTVTPPAGTDGYAPVTVDAVTAAIDANIQPGNIKQGVDILGVVGSLVQGVAVTDATFVSDTIALADILMSTDRGNQIKTYKDTTYTGALNFTNCTSLEEIERSACTASLSQSTHDGCTALKVVKYPAVTSVGVRTFRSSPLVFVVFGTLTTFADALYYAKPKLRNITVGAGTAIALNFRYWTATDVIAEGADAIDELNANIVSGLADRVADRTGDSALTITFGTSLYNVLTAETLAAFTSKNWNVAYA